MNLTGDGLFVLLFGLLVVALVVYARNAWHRLP